MVLISLGLIVSSGFHYRKELGRLNGYFFPIFTSGVTLFFAMMTYFIDPIVVLFSIIVLVLSYLIHDLISMERISLRIFSGMFEIILLVIISVFLTSYRVFIPINTSFISTGTANLALVLLLAAGIANITDGMAELYAIRGKYY